jgi:hypothetical protein
MPALHCAMTSFGVLTMNIGAPITGRVSLSNTAGKRGIVFPMA